MCLWFRYAALLVVPAIVLSLVAKLVFTFAEFIAPPLKPQHIQSIGDWYKYLYSTDAVAIEFFSSTFYGLDQEGANNYQHLMPQGGDMHLVRLNDDDNGMDGIYTVALFHQLKCLEICHRALVEGTSLDDLPPVVGHCLNYLRQQVICRVDSTLESGTSDGGDTGRYYSSVCRDWTKVYEAAHIRADFNAGTQL